MAQFDMAGFGPKSQFDPSVLSEGARKGLERAIVDGHKILSESPRAGGRKGWGPIRELYGQYGFDYLRRATVEFNGLLGNLPEESTYPSLVADEMGNFLVGKKQYRLVFKADELPPVDAFWSLSAYDAQSIDLIPNPIARYSIGDRTKGLKRKSDGTIEILIQSSPPTDPDINWLPVGDRMFFLTLRMYQPRPAAFDGRYHLPALEVLPTSSSNPQ